MGTMHRARVLAFQIIYSWDFEKKSDPELLFASVKDLSPDDFDAASEAYIKLTVCGTLENIQTVDSTIKKHIKNWNFDRISRIDLAILRLSVYGLLFQKDTDGKIIINEAVKLAQEFGGDDSYRFVNGVLDAIYKENDKN
ncbi:MAG: transcription antitermination factor NusB [Spirochaetia bacterium]|nr:transcription antitermination factor NusB [Spirochaetia bacterium]MBR4437355.1 transcription antitermination factor NusB [Spirochaetales bacterium]MBR5915059.1 transcription antitermination factor NusB [Spirochaetia bacterium]